MKLHPKSIEKLLHLYDIWGGYREDTKLRAQLNEVDFTVYTQQDGTEILVPTDAYNEEMRKAAGG